MQKRGVFFKVTTTACVMLFLSVSAFAKHLHDEQWYQDQWCAGRGQAEYILPDKTRCDCLTATHAIEVDFAPKWYEAVGQALYYSLQTGKKAGILLIIEKPSDRKYWIRLNAVIKHFALPIDVWSIGPFAYGGGHG